MKKLFALAFCLLISNVVFAEKHPFSFDDMAKMTRISSPQVSPDGKWMIFVGSLPNMKTNKVEKDLWLIGTDGSGLKQLTKSPTPDYNVVWLPDSKEFLFISVDKGSSQVWQMDPVTLKKKQITKLPVDVDNLILFPDGKNILFSVSVFPECKDLECTAKKDKEISDNPSKVYAFDDLLFRHWDTWADGKVNHLFMMPLAGGTPVDITADLKADAPTKPWGGTEEISISPDNKEVAYTAKVEANPATHTNHDIFVVNLETKKSECITCENKATDTAPAYSPDGKYIAYLAMKRPGFESDRYTIMLYDRAAKTKKPLTILWDRSPQTLAWSIDSKTIFATAENHANNVIYAVDVATGKEKAIVEKHYNNDLILNGDRLYFTQDSFTSPAEIYTAKLDGSDFKQVTFVNKPIVDEIIFSQPEEFWFKGAGGDMVHGFVFKPVNFKEGEKYPLAYFIHGGPQGAFEDHFHYRWNLGIAPGRGYAAATVNFHGSTGYGQAFTDAISKNWGGKPYEDIMKGLDDILAKNKWIDSKKMCALGASYGGYMINWINGHTDRFACLITHDGEFSNYAAFFNTEELWFPQWEFGKNPIVDEKGYTQWSPDRFVKNWKTPTLVVHGAKDYRLVDTEGMSVFTALKVLGVPARFVYFPDENHWVLKPLNSKRWHEEVYGWMDKWTKNVKR